MSIHSFSLSSVIRAWELIGNHFTLGLITANHRRRSRALHLIEIPQESRLRRQLLSIHAKGAFPQKQCLCVLCVRVCVFISHMHVGCAGARKRAHCPPCSPFPPRVYMCVYKRVSCKAKSIRHSIAFPPRSLGGRGTCDLFCWPIYEVRDTVRRCDSKWKIELSPSSSTRRKRLTKYKALGLVTPLKCTLLSPR